MQAFCTICADSLFKIKHLNLPAWLSQFWVLPAATTPTCLVSAEKVAFDFDSILYYSIQMYSWFAMVNCETSNGWKDNQHFIYIINSGAIL